jgi:hypothetical protein
LQENREEHGDLLCFIYEDETKSAQKKEPQGSGRNNT